MQKFTADDPETKSADVIGDNLEALKGLFPDAFSEGKVDFEVLKQLLGNSLNEGDEKYGLNWHGKRAARQLALTPSNGTLRPCSEESVEWHTTQNLMIEGDNLEVLKLLQKSYAGKVKLIYIDPPYNTGSDFVYPDDFKDGVSNYLRLTGQAGETGHLVSNPESSGRFHSAWLSMMYPRLRVARSLLRSDGVIFISIDDGEVGHLRALCDDVFGQENFFAQIPWQSRTSVQNDTDLSVQHEYLVGYAVNRRREHRRLKESNVATWFSLPSFAAYPLPVNDERYHNPDDDPRGAWKADPFDAPNVRDNLTYAITNPQTGEEHWPPAGRCWRTEEPKFESLLADGRIVFGRTGKSRPQLKVFYEEKKLFGEVPVSWFSGTEYGTSTAGTKELQDLFDGVSPFSFPKPTSLLQALLRLTTRDDDLVMDFFAGSGTTAHAVWKQNAEDQGDRRWIQVQLPEPLDPDKPAERAAVQLCDDLGAPRLISTLTKERIRRAASAFGEQAGDLADVATTDRGFRVLKLDSSNIEAWEPNRDDLGGSLTDAIEHLKDDRTEHDILFELLLKLGLELTVPVETREVAGKTVYSVGAGTLLVCLAESLDQGDVEAIGLGIVEWHEELDPAGDSTVVFRDNAFADDVAKTNLTAILEQHGLSTVRSL